MFNALFGNLLAPAPDFPLPNAAAAPAPAAAFPPPPAGMPAAPPAAQAPEEEAPAQPRLSLRERMRQIQAQQQQ